MDCTKYPIFLPVIIRFRALQATNDLQITLQEVVHTLKRSNWRFYRSEKILQIRNLIANQNPTYGFSVLAKMHYFYYVHSFFILHHGCFSALTVNCSCTSTIDCTCRLCWCNFLFIAVVVQSCYSSLQIIL